MKLSPAVTLSRPRHRYPVMTLIRSLCNCDHRRNFTAERFNQFSITQRTVYRRNPPFDGRRTGGWPAMNSHEGAESFGGPFMKHFKGGTAAGDTHRPRCAPDDFSIKYRGHSPSSPLNQASTLYRHTRGQRWL